MKTLLIEGYYFIRAECCAYLTPKLAWYDVWLIALFSAIHNLTSSLLELLTSIVERNGEVLYRY